MSDATRNEAINEIIASIRLLNQIDIADVRIDEAVNRLQRAVDLLDET